MEVCVIILAVGVGNLTVYIDGLSQIFRRTCFRNVSIGMPRFLTAFKANKNSFAHTCIAGIHLVEAASAYGAEMFCIIGVLYAHALGAFAVILAAIYA